MSEQFRGENIHSLKESEESIKAALEEQPSSSENYLNPETASLKEMMQSEKKIIYIPRKIDIERFKRLADLGRQISDSDRDDVRVLDVGGGHGFIDKLLADEFNRDKNESLVVDMDIDQKTLQGAKKAYGHTKGLEFLKADAENEGAKLFSENFDLIIASWPRPTKFFEPSCAYSELIHKNKPPFVIWIGDPVIGDLTAEFNTKDNYTPIAEWYGRHIFEAGALLNPQTTHGHVPDPKQGSNLFTVYMRNDIPKKNISIIEKSLKRRLDKEKYQWEKELHHKFPQDSDMLSFEVKKRHPEK